MITAEYRLKISCSSCLLNNSYPTFYESLSVSLFPSFVHFAYRLCRAGANPRNQARAHHGVKRGPLVVKGRCKGGGHIEMNLLKMTTKNVQRLGVGDD